MGWGRMSRDRVGSGVGGGGGWRGLPAAHSVWWARPLALVASLLCMVVLLANCAPFTTTRAVLPRGPIATPPTPTVVVFDPGAGAPLPTHRIVAAYGIVGGGPSNGPASSLDMLDAWLPQLQQLGNQYAALDPTHPVLLGIDLVVNVIQPCGAYPQWCASWADDATIQAYVAYCQQHHLLLFFDLQLATEPVADAVTAHLMP